MEASDALEQTDGQSGHEPDDEAHTVVGDEGQDVAKDDNSQQPIGEDPGGTGTVTPRSAPDPQHQTGEVAGDQEQGAGEGEGEPQE